MDIHKVVNSIGIVVTIVATLVGGLIAGLVWIVALHGNVGTLNAQVADLRNDVAQLKQEIAEMKAGAPRPAECARPTAPGCRAPGASR